ncbi:MAG: serine/threonine-protein kinase [Candidatus Acidiferrum sp.]
MQQVGRYQVVEIVGQGANSKVARGFDPLIGRTVAIKLLSSDLARGDARQRFIQEARVVGQLSHPSIISLHDMGIEESTQTPYLVMEYLSGPALDQILAKGPIPYPKACAWVADVAIALSIAHHKGIIHGDVKPANVLTTAEGRVKLTDFGMARLARRDTMDSSLAGTPAYWCPEQIIGKPQDARSDLFSLGVVLYEMTTGRRPFDGQTLPAICERLLSTTPLLPSHANPSLPASLDEVIGACLVKDPGERIGSAEELANLLYPLARRKVATPVTAPATTLRSRASRLLRSA